MKSREQISAAHIHTNEINKTNAIVSLMCTYSIKIRMQHNHPPNKIYYNICIYIFYYSFMTTGCRHFGTYRDISALVQNVWIDHRELDMYLLT